MNTRIMAEIDWDLLAKYISGECNHEELAHIKALLLDNENKKLLNQLMKIYDATALNSMDLNESFLKLTDRMNRDNLI